MNVENQETKDGTQTHLSFAMKSLVKTDPKNMSSTLVHLPKPLNHTK